MKIQSHRRWARVVRLVAWSLPVACLLLAVRARAEEPAKPAEAKPAEKPKYPPFAEVLKDAKPTAEPSLIKMYQKGEQPLRRAHQQPFQQRFHRADLDCPRHRRRAALGRHELGLWRRLAVAVPQGGRQRFTSSAATSASRPPRAARREGRVELAYTDSVLFSLPIVTMGPSGGTIVDLTPVFMSDLPQISPVLPGFSFAANKSTWASGQGLQGQCRTGSRRHLRLERHMRTSTPCPTAAA